MPVRQPPVTDFAVRVLLDSIVDYAGLFPPASVSMATAVRNFAHYRASTNGWMLGRFICPAGSLGRFSEEAEQYLPRDAGAIAWQLSVTGSGDCAQDMTAILAFNERHRVCFDECSATVDAYEVKASSVADVKRIHEDVPVTLRTFIEVPLTGDPVPMVEAIAACGRRAKMRTGGTAPEAFPTAEQVAHFLVACAQTGVVAKATAGLHHPLRDVFRLTYEENSPRSLMFGYLNVFLATALVGSGASSRDLVAMLEERDPSHITFDATHCFWSGGSKPYALDRAFLAQMRDRGLVSFGSCSFTEPVQETRALGWL
ncbi:MAG: hypothetical protein H7Z40_23730 [Phycisphaerae bacterium]|nr:hypothetical protein [Gemmatimonadaceae bacterium]